MRATSRAIGVPALLTLALICAGAGAALGDEPPRRPGSAAAPAFALDRLPPGIRPAAERAGLSWTRSAGDAVRGLDRVEIVRNPGAEDDAQEWYEVAYTVDPVLEALVRDALERAGVALGHVILMDPASGEVFAYVSTDPDVFPPVRAYPTASLMKVVTAAALLERSPETPRTLCRYEGSPYRLVSAQLDSPGVTGGLSQPFSQAIAISNNQCFAQLAVHQLGQEALQDEIRKVGLLDAPAARHPPGRIDPIAGAIDLGELGSGLAGSFITPLAAARLAALLSNGELVQPYWIAAVRDARGDLLGVPPPPDPARVWSPEVASELREMLVAVTAYGTASRGFHNRRGEPLLGPVRVAGKTGTLSGTDPPGRYQWFIGVAPAEAPRIAVAAIVVNDPPGLGSAARVAAASLRAVFCEGDACDASRVERLHARSEALAADRRPVLREAGELDQAPRPVDAPRLELPERLLHEPVDGQIELVLELDPSGGIIDVRVASSDLPEFEECVAAQVRAWKFMPPRHRGRPAYARARLPIPIRIQ